MKNNIEDKFYNSKQSFMQTPDLQEVDHSLKLLEKYYSELGIKFICANYGTIKYKEIMKNKNNIEDKFFGKRIVKEIFAKAKFAHKNLSALITKAKQLGIEYAKEGYGSPSAGDSRWQKLHSELLAGGGGSQHSPENVQAEKEMLNAFMEANKKERSRLGFSRTGGKVRFEWTKELGQKIQTLKRSIGVSQDNLRDLEKKGDHNNCVGYCQSLSSLYSQLGKAFGDAARNTMSRTGGKTKFEINRRYGLPEFTKQKILDMIKTGKYESIYDVKEGLVELRNNVTKKIVRVYCAG